MKNRLYFTTLLLFSLLFFIPSIVKADTSLTFSDYYINFDTEYPTFLQNKETILNTINSYSSWEQAYQVIANNNNSAILNVYDCSSSGSYTFSFSGLTYGRCWAYSFNNDYTSVSYNGRISLTLIAIAPYSSYYGYFYSDYDFIAYLTGSGYDSIVIPSYTSTVYNVTIPEIVLHDGDTIPTYDYIYNTYIATLPTPSDNYPILTSFFTTFIDRLSFLCEYIYSSYVFLSIFVVLLIYISIMFLRRLI